MNCRNAHCSRVFDSASATEAQFKSISDGNLTMRSRRADPASSARRPRPNRQLTISNSTPARLAGSDDTLASAPVNSDLVQARGTGAAGIFRDWHIAFPLTAQRRWATFMK